MENSPQALLERLYGWVLELSHLQPNGEAFLQEHGALHQQVMDFGSKLEELDELESVEVPDELFVAAANLLEVLDILWDRAEGEEVDLAEPAELLVQTRWILEQTLPVIELAVEELSVDNSGVDI